MKWAFAVLVLSACAPASIPPAPPVAPPPAAPLPPPAPEAAPEPSAPVILGEDPPRAATDGDLSEWARVPPIAKLESGGARARGWASMTRDRVRFALEVRGNGALGGVRVTVQLPGVELPPVGEEESADTCMEAALSPRCDWGSKPCFTKREAIAHCARFVPRSREIREMLGRAFRRTYTVRGAALWADNSAIEGTRVAVRPTNEGYAIEGELPSEALPRTAQAPLASAQWSFEIIIGQAGLVSPDSLPDLKIEKPVRFGAMPVLLERVGAPLYYAPGPSTSTAIVIGHDYDAPDQKRAIVELPVEVGERAVLHRAGARALARLVVPTLQGPATAESLLLLEDGELDTEVAVPGAVVGHGPLGGRYAVLAADMSSYGFHFHTFYRANVSVIWFDDKLASNEVAPLYESGCRGVLGPKPSVRGLSATLHCTTGGYDSDEPLRRFPPRALSVRWSDAKNGYVVQ